MACPLRGLCLSQGASRVNWLRDGWDPLRYAASHRDKRGITMGQPFSTPGASWQPAQPSQPPAEAPASDPVHKRRIWGGVAGLIAIVLVAGAVGFQLGRSSATPSPSEAAEAAATQESRLQSAYDDCKRRDEDDTLEVTDEGATIVIDTGSEYGSTAGMDCVLAALDTPGSIEAQIGRTTSMMGVQDADNDGLQYSWSYHPDNGVNMVITEGT